MCSGGALIYSPLLDMAISGEKIALHALCWWHSGSTAVTQKEVPGFSSWVGRAFLCLHVLPQVCMGFLHNQKHVL